MRADWAARPASYLGLAIEGYPNLFTITGPGSPSVLTNVVASIEQHVEWLSDLFVHMRENGLAEIEAAADAQAEWVAHTYDLATTAGPVGTQPIVMEPPWILAASRIWRIPASSKVIAR